MKAKEVQMKKEHHEALFKDCKLYQQGMKDYNEGKMADGNGKWNLMSIKERRLHLIYWLLAGIFREQNYEKNSKFERIFNEIVQETEG